MAKTAPSENKVDFSVTESDSLRRVFFNRFKCGRVGDAVCVRVWFQDEMMRTCNAYAFIMTSEDIKSCRASVEKYLMKLLEGRGHPNVEGVSSESYPSEIQVLDTFRMMTCVRIENRAEICLSYYPLTQLLATAQGRKGSAKMETCLVSDLATHIAILKTILDE